ncbi:MAG: SPFH domain-containing protein [Eubacteriales bacterium]|nr:SPFH domain-containing protein [Eubacteriales bacterium]MDD4718000.1 SPFH domain-containing protein [Eubacteriales bacterium]
MGLLKAGIGALSGVLADQWREYFYSEALSSDVLISKGRKRTSKRSSNTKAEDNIISNGSIISVNNGQCMMIIEQGKVVDICAEPGEFVYDTSTEPSIFYGGLGAGLIKSFETLGKRFTFGGDTAKDQRVYYVNTKEIMGNKYGTPNPVPFRVVDKNIGLDIDIAIRCHGEYSYKIVDPLLFYANVSGNVENEYSRENIDGMLKTELMTALQPAFAKISEMGIRYSALPGHTMELADALNEVLSKKWTQLRGVAVASFGVSSVSASEEDELMIKQLQKSAVMRDPTMAAATLVGAQSDAMRAAAENEGGAMMGFMGLGMAQNAGGSNVQNLFAMGQQQEQAQAQAQAGNKAESKAQGWNCSCGAGGNSGKFCMECGKPKPDVSGSWTCSCGAGGNTGKFCMDCGAPRPADAASYKCNKCGWEPEKSNTPPKFCPECGDVFDDGDKI